MKRSCPKCGSQNISVSFFNSLPVISCHECSYDESADLEVYPEERSTQRGKSRFTPYKHGGHARTRKK